MDQFNFARALRVDNVQESPWWVIERPGASPAQVFVARQLVAEPMRLIDLDRVTRREGPALLLTIWPNHQAETGEYWLGLANGRIETKWPFSYPLELPLHTANKQQSERLSSLPPGWQPQHRLTLPDRRQIGLRCTATIPFDPRYKIPEAPVEEKTPPGGRRSQVPHIHGYSAWLNAGRPKAMVSTARDHEGLVVIEADDKEHRLGQAELGSTMVSTWWVLADGTTWVGFYDAPPVRLDLTRRAVIDPPGAQAPSGVSVLVTSPQYLWAGTFTKGLFRADPAGRQWQPVPAIPACRVNDVHPDEVDPQVLWISTDQGLFRLVTP